MKVVYFCEICGSKHANVDAALKCEARGYPTDVPPPGTMFAHEKDEVAKGRGNLFIAVVAAHVETGKSVVAPWEHDRHAGKVAVWWFRGNGCGETPNKAWFAEFGELGEVRADVGPDTKDWRTKDFYAMPHNAAKDPTVLRVLAFLKVKGIEPKHVVDGQVVPFEVKR